MLGFPKSKQSLQTQKSEVGIWRRKNEQHEIQISLLTREIKRFQGFDRLLISTVQGCSFWGSKFYERASPAIYIYIEGYVAANQSITQPAKRKSPWTQRGKHKHHNWITAWHLKLSHPSLFWLNGDDGQGCHAKRWTHHFQRLTLQLLKICNPGQNFCCIILRLLNLYVVVTSKLHSRKNPHLSGS